MRLKGKFAFFYVNASQSVFMVNVVNWGKKSSACDIPTMNTVFCCSIYSSSDTTDVISFKKEPQVISAIFLPSAFALLSKCQKLRATHRGTHRQCCHSWVSRRGQSVVHTSGSDHLVQISGWVDTHLHFPLVWFGFAQAKFQASQNVSTKAMRKLLFHTLVRSHIGQILSPPAVP